MAECPTNVFNRLWGLSKSNAVQFCFFPSKPRRTLRSLGGAIMCLMWAGNDCREELNPCNPSPCQNSGICTPNADYIGYTCLCADGFQGKCNATVQSKPRFEMSIYSFVPRYFIYSCFSLDLFQFCSCSVRSELISQNLKDTDGNLKEKPRFHRGHHLHWLCS